MLENIDLLIAGAGPVGCVIAERAASQLGWRCLIVEKRSHIGGNCYDRYDENGILIHQYGPHYFRTDNPALIDYLSEFTGWIAGNYIVKSYVNGEYFPFPVNPDTLEQFFNRRFTPEEAKAFLDTAKIDFSPPHNSEELVLSRVGRELYEAFYLNYTLKQWEKHPRDLLPEVCGRIPVRFNRDPRYVDQRFQMMPALGYTAMFQRMLDHPNIHVLLQTDFHEVRKHCKPRYATVYSGPVDVYFDCRFGTLPWRSLHFEWYAYEAAYRQSCAQINYPNDFFYTRSFESKHITGQVHPKTVVSYEYSRESGDPYYPVPAPENQALYRQYLALAEQEMRENNVFFIGRLAQYRYMNSDEAIEQALSLFETLRALKR